MVVRMEMLRDVLAGPDLRRLECHGVLGSWCLLPFPGEGAWLTGGVLGELLCRWMAMLRES